MGEDKCEYVRTYGLGIYVNDLHGRPHQGHQDARGWESREAASKKRLHIEETGDCGELLWI